MRFATMLMAAAGAVILSTSVHADVNIYSARQESLIKPQLDAFTKATGIKANLVTGDAKELIQRIKSEGANSPADLLFTADAGNLGLAKADGLFQATKSAALDAAIPKQYRDPEGHWFGLGVRARPIFHVVGGKIPAASLATYEALAAPGLKGQILVRSSGHIYNQSLLASIIAHDGPAKAEAWAKGVADNLARKPQGGDRDQIKAAAAGEGEIALANSYYYAQMMTSSKADEVDAAKKLKVVWPNQDGRGVHVNISGAGIVATAKNKADAVKLLEYLVTDDAQKIYAEQGQEFPVKAGVPASKELQALGSFKADTLDLAALGKHNAEAVKIFDRVGWR